MNGYRFHHRLATALLLTAGLFLLAGCQALKGDAPGTVQLGTATLNFGTVIVNTTSTLGNTITNNTTSSVTIASIQGLTSEFQVTGLTLPVTLAAGQVISFSVVFQPTAVGNPTITISFDDQNSQPIVSLPTSGVGATVGTLLPTPSQLVFGNIVVGSTQSSSVVLSNSGGTALNINQATLSGAGFTLSNLPVPMTLQPGGSTSATITFAPPSTGNFSGGITFVTDADGVSKNVVLNLSGAGVAPGTLSPSPSSLAFGSIQVGAKASLSETLTNTGSSSVTITQVTPSGTGFSVTGLTLPVTLASSQTISFTANFSPTSAGADTGSLSIVSNASNSPLSIPLSGTALAAGALSASPSSENFGNVTVGANKSVPIVVTNTGGESVIISSAAASGTGFTVTGQTPPITLTAGQSATFNAVFTPTAAGASTGALTITSNATNPTLSVPLSGTGVAQGDLVSSPTTFSFGNIQDGTSKSLPGTLTNTGGSTLTISAASASGTGFSLSGLTLPVTLTAGQSTSFSVLFSPTSPGAASGSVTITSNGSNPNLSIPLSGTGVTQGTLTANPTSISFVNVQVGNSTSISETLTNTGGSTVTISSATVTGTAFSISGLTLPLSLTTGQSVTFTATFTPATAGAASGSISVASNASNSPLAIALSGTGTAAGTLAVSPTTLAFGNVNVGSSSALAGSLTASGSAVTVNSASSNSSEFVLSGISLPITIPAGQSSTFTVTFTPQSSGAASASLSFTSNASNSPAVQSLTGTGVTATQHTVDLTWTASSGAVGYNIYRGTVSGGPYAMINSSLDSTTAYTDNTVTSGTTYYYVTTAVNSSSEESGYSNQATAVIPTP
ncbi:MAG TPA: choice-of-anchor D domain-containing protein [Terriglobales bacterium]|nr:choice-of-anchor D domain-containing protein [Terriglobales bacterium]